MSVFLSAPRGAVCLSAKLAKLNRWLLHRAHARTALPARKAGADLTGPCKSKQQMPTSLYSG